MPNHQPEPTDPYPTLQDATREAAVVAEHARAFYGDRLVSVWLYGSRARADNRADSDLDVLLVRDFPADLDPDQRFRDRSGIDFHDYLEREMDGYSLLLTFIEIRSVQPVQLETWDTMYFRSVREDGIRVL